ncbi:MAG: adenylosuccinate lyase [Thermosediminibacterales bacterium]|nr:adenylosuccinate lyase [Thermosediminibacterales bacterium]MDK2835986.1 adenylosuccinate lyase [Thermosediminibacterales bacterium]
MRLSYENPLIKRYSSKEMAYNFSDTKKFRTWRKLWIALAEAQKQLGLDITDEQIKEMKRYENEINFDDAEALERELKHDVMAHVHAYGKQCPKAKPVLHLGATSAFVGDNTDIILMRDGLEIIKKKLVNCIYHLKNFVEKNKSVITLGYTHFQPAQLTTVGKRACLWLQDLLMDLEELDFRLSNLKLRGAKGTTGTQASYMKLFNNDEKKVEELDRLVAEKLGFDKTFPVTGQTYPRKLDDQIISTLKGIAESAHKFSNDIRLLQNLNEIEEPFEEKQVGSSAMAYKRNPMRSERIAALSRFLIVTSLNTAVTASNQWLERTLDDSANRRITIPEAFLCCDGILNLYLNIVKGLKVYHKVIKAHVESQIPFMATENIIMESVKKGKDRQELHERIRRYSMEAIRLIREDGKENTLLDRILNDEYIGLTYEEIQNIINPKNFIGRSISQVDKFLKDFIDPVLEKYRDLIGVEEEVRV